MHTILRQSWSFAQRAAVAACLLASAGLLFLGGSLVAQTPAEPAPPVLPPPAQPAPPSPVPAPADPAQPNPFLPTPRNPTLPPPSPVTPAPANPDPNLPPGLRFDVPPADDPNSPIAPAVSAQFEPAIGRIGRPLEYRVVITAGQRIHSLPGLTLPDGLTFVPIAPRFEIPTINAQQVFKSTLRYRVQAEEEGNYVVPSFPLQIGKHRVQVPATRILVVGPQPGDPVSQPVRAVLDLPKRDFYVGEAIQARLLCIDSPDEETQFVSHVAKSSGSLLFRPARRMAEKKTFVWEGKPSSGMALPVEITPLVAGETETNCQVMVQVRKKDLYGRMVYGPQATLDTPSVRFRVLPLPQSGRPAGFTGAIGKFTVGQPQMSAKEVEVGEPLGIQLELRGTGNVDGVPPPEFPKQEDWMAYRPTSNYEPDENGGGVKTYTFTLVPKRAGTKSTPALPFSYFDPEAREFRDISIPPLPVTVKAGAAPVPSEVAKADAPPLIDAPTEVPPALTGLAEQPGRWLNSPAPALRSFLIVQFAPPCLLLSLWAWRKRREYLAHNPGVIRRRKARAAARAALATARAAAQRNDFPAFLTAGLGALREAAAPLDSAQASSLTREEVLRPLRHDQRAAQAAESFFQSAEASRYASDMATTANPAAMLPELEHAVARLTALA